MTGVRVCMSAWQRHQYLPLDLRTYKCKYLSSILNIILYIFSFANVVKLLLPVIVQCSIKTKTLF